MGKKDPSYGYVNGENDDNPMDLGVHNIFRQMHKNIHLIIWLLVK